MFSTLCSFTLISVDRTNGTIRSSGNINQNHGAAQSCGNIHRTKWNRVLFGYSAPHCLVLVLCSRFSRSLVQR